MNLGYTIFSTVSTAAGLVGAGSTAGASVVVSKAINFLAEKAIVGLANWAVTEITDIYAPNVPAELESSDQNMWIFDFARDGLGDVSSFEALELRFDVGFDGAPGPLHIVTDTRFVYSMTGAGFVMTGGTVAGNGYVGEVRRSHTITPVALGIQPEPNIDVVLDGSSSYVHAYDFNQVAIGDSRSRVFRVHNSGSETLIVDQASGLGSDFTITPENDSSSSDDWTLLAGTSRTFTVTFSPTSEGDISDTLSVHSNDPEESAYEINLTGTGVAVVQGDQFEDDDSPSRATVISTDGAPQEHSIHVGSDIDWVKFTLAERSNVTIETDGPSGDTRMWLYGPNNWSNEIEYDDDGGARLWSRIVRSGGDALNPGTYYVKIDEYRNNNVIDSYGVSVTAVEAVGPMASLSANAGAAQRSMLTSFTADFSEDVSASVSVGDLVVRNVLTDESIAVADMAVAYDAAHDTATWTFPGLPGGSLPDGNWEATLLAAGIADAAGNNLDGDGVMSCFRFFGDGDGDRDVDFLDVLAFRRTNLKNSASPDYDPRFDADGDGDVDFLDVLRFRQNNLKKMEVPFGLVASATSITVPEGSTAEFTVALSAQPLGTVTVTTSRTSGDEDLAVTSGGTLIFDRTNWNIPQPVTIAAAEDNDAIGGSAQFAVSAAGTVDVLVRATEHDQDSGVDVVGWTQPGGNRQGLRAYPVGSQIATTDELILKTSLHGAGVLTGDVDGDGLLETITTSGDQLRIYAEDLSIQTQVTMPGEGYVTMVEDVNGDGIADIGIGARGNARGQAYFYDGSGTLLQTFTRSVGYDGFMSPLAVLNGGRVLMEGAAGYSKDPRGLYVYDFATGAEVWGYDLGGFGILQPSMADIDGDGRDEFTVGWQTVHNGGSANGTTDGDLYLVVLDDDGTNLVTQIYPSPSNGSVGHLFVDLDRDGTTEILSIERHDPTYYQGINQVHIYDTAGNTLYTYDGPNNENWMWAVADTDGDGKDNVIVGGLTTLVILDEHLNEINSVADDGYVELAVDLTGDGSPEIVTRNASGLVRVYNSSLALLDSMQLTRTGTIIASDVDADGVIELLIPGTDGQIAVIAFAASQPMLAETFEAAAVGTWPDGWTADANAISDPSRNEVVLDPASGSGKALELFGAIGASWAAIAYRPVTFTEDFSVMVRVYNGAEALSGAHPDRAAIGMKQGTSWTNVGRGLLQFRGDGTLVAADGAALTTYDTERWYDVRIDYHRSGTNLLLHYWLDGLDLGVRNLTIDNITHELSFDHLNLTAQEGSAFFDDISVLPL